MFDLSSDDYDNDQIEKMVLSASLCHHVSPLIPASDDFDTTFTFNECLVNQYFSFNIMNNKIVVHSLHKYLSSLT